MANENEKIFEQKVEACPKCNHSPLVRDYLKSEILCPNCGVVVWQVEEEPKHKFSIELSPKEHIQLLKALICFRHSKDDDNDEMTEQIIHKVIGLQYIEEKQSKERIVETLCDYRFCHATAEPGKKFCDIHLEKMKQQ